MFTRCSSKEAEYINKPIPGDVYQIRGLFKDSTQYNFLKLVRINGDSMFFYQNNFEYDKHTDVLDRNDYFDKSEMYYSYKEIKKMYDKKKVHFIMRDYPVENGFNRVKESENSPEKQLYFLFSVTDYFTGAPVENAEVEIYRGRTLLTKVKPDTSLEIPLTLYLDNVYTFKFSCPNYLTRIVKVDTRYVPFASRYEKGWDIPVDMVLVATNKLNNCETSILDEQEKNPPTLRYNFKSTEIEWDMVAIQNMRNKIEACIKAVAPASAN